MLSYCNEQHSCSLQMFSNPWSLWYLHIASWPVFAQVCTKGGLLLNLTEFIDTKTEALLSSRLMLFWSCDFLLVGQKRQNLQRIITITIFTMCNMSTLYFLIILVFVWYFCNTHKNEADQHLRPISLIVRAMVREMTDTLLKNMSQMREGAAEQMQHPCQVSRANA